MPSDPDKLTVELGTRSYDILIGKGLLRSSGTIIRNTIGNGNCWIITDKNLAPLYLPLIQKSLAEAAIQSHTIILPSGEDTKSFETIKMITDRVLDKMPERGSTLVALGGGVVGDLTGFAASVILRGINFIQIPTTLLAQVDSSVGGKTGINTPHGKNLIGAFYQPSIVITDTDVLNSLPQREMLAGYAEVVKYGLIRDAAFFKWLEKNGIALVDGEFEALRYAIHKSCVIKAGIVAEDEYERGTRALLNFGHTFGHALEAETEFGAELNHGEAVSIGMTLACKLSNILGFFESTALNRVVGHFKRIGLMTNFPQIENQQWKPKKIIGHMAHDKKNKSGRNTFVLIRNIGEAFVSDDVDIEVVERLLKELNS
ncbi:MAG: 3-dehydroquinate synthase [Pseudomonadota bacterium]|nr:3-dehydroquinate synthase [Pseudomonadota bacterium]